jgi:hypothetical protein
MTTTEMLGFIARLQVTNNSIPPTWCKYNCINLIIRLTINITAKFVEIHQCLGTYHKGILCFFSIEFQNGPQASVPSNNQKYGDHARVCWPVGPALCPTALHPLSSPVLCRVVDTYHVMRKMMIIKILMRCIFETYTDLNWKIWFID